MADYNAAIRAIARPPGIERLKISPTGFPVPWFVHVDAEGVADFRVVRRGGIGVAWRKKLCWICGEPLYPKRLAMTLGPMCAVNRTISEPPSHRACAVYAAMACPFLANPRMRRNTVGLPDHVDAPGTAIKRNPGAVCVWITDQVRPFTAPGGSLFTFGEPSEVLWFVEGRPATRAEVTASIESGLPLLAEEAVRDGADAIRALRDMTLQAMRYLPA